MLEAWILVSICMLKLMMIMSGCMVIGLTSKSSSAVGSLYFKVCKRDEVGAIMSGVATTSGVVASSSTTSLKLYYYTVYQLKTGRYDLYAWTKTKDCSLKGGWNP